MSLDLSDLMDYEIAAVDKIGRELSRRFTHKSSNRKNYEELAKVANELFIDAGLVVKVDYSAALILGEFPVIEIIGRVPGHTIDKDGYDHERHQKEVRRSKELGEKYDGQRRAWSD